MRALAATLAALSLAACAASTWQWRRPDGSLAEDQLKEDIDACEEYALIADMGHPGFEGPLGARPRGGWGNFSFERCMHERDWALTRVKPRTSNEPGPPAPATPQCRAIELGARCAVGAESG